MFKAVPVCLAGVMVLLAVLACGVSSTPSDPRVSDRPNRPHMNLPPQKQWPAASTLIVLRSGSAPNRLIFNALDPQTDRFYRLDFPALPATNLWAQPHVWTANTLFGETASVATQPYPEAAVPVFAPASQHAAVFDPATASIRVYHGDQPKAILPFASAASFDPTGTRLAFAYTIIPPNLGQRRHGLAVYDLTTNDSYDLLTDEPAAIEHVVWSPQGEMLAVVREVVLDGGGSAEYNREVFLVPVAGGVPQKIYQSGVFDDLKWSPSGAWLLMSAGNRTALYNLPEAKIYGINGWADYAWSPHADQLAHLRITGTRLQPIFPSGTASINQYDLFITEDVRSGQARQLTNLKFELNDEITLGWVDLAFLPALATAPARAPVTWSLPAALWPPTPTPRPTLEFMPGYTPPPPATVILTLGRVVSGSAAQQVLGTLTNNSRPIPDRQLWLVAITATLSATAHPAGLFVLPQDVWLETSAGFQHQHYLPVVRHPELFGNRTLKPGETTSGWVGFYLALSEIPARLHFVNHGAVPVSLDWPAP